MRPIEKATLDKLRARLAEARDAEYQALVNVANSSIGSLETKLVQLQACHRVVSDMQMCIARLDCIGRGSDANAEAEVYASKEPQRVWEDGTPVVFPGGPLGDW